MMNDQPPITPDNQTPNLDDVPTIPPLPTDNSPVENVTPVEPAPIIDVDAENLHIQDDSEPDTTPIASTAPIVNPINTTPVNMFDSANETPTATPSIQPVVSGPVIASAQPSRNGHKKLAISLSVVGVLIVLVVGAYFGVKIWADNTATTYADDLKVFSGKLDQAFNNPSDGQALRRSVDNIKTPSLDSIPLSFVSPKYTDAAGSTKGIADQYATLKSQVSEYATYDTFITKYNAIASQMSDDLSGITASSNSDIDKTFDKTVAGLQQASDLVDSTDFAASLGSAKNDLQAAYAAEITAVNDLKKAFDNKDSAAFSAGLDDLDAVTLQESSAFDKVRTYTDDLQTKIEATSNKLNSLIEKVVNNK